MYKTVMNLVDYIRALEEGRICKENIELPHEYITPKVEAFLTKDGCLAFKYVANKNMNYERIKKDYLRNVT